MAADNVKISEFIGKDSLLSTALVTFVQNGTNFNINFSDFVSELGVTGTIVQDGSVTGTPVLDIQGAVNNIRNLENGSGVKASVSPENGITLDHNFTQNTIGIPFLINPTAASPSIVSAVAGTGISIASLPDGSVQFAVTLEPAATTTVIIAKEADFPTAIGGVITLDPRTDYFLVASVTTANRFVLQADTLVRAIDSSQADLTYTGTGTMLTSVDASNKITRVSLDCPNGKLFDISSTTGAHVFQMVDLTVNSCDELGAISNLFAAQISDVIFLNIITDGLKFSGDNSIFIVQTALFIIEAGTLFDLGTATFSTFTYTSSQTTLNGSSVMLSGATGSANIATGGLGTVINTRIQGTGTALVGISTDDALWQFEFNDDIADTRTDGLLSMQGNATNTVITSAGVGVLTAGTWVVEDTGQMSGTTSGRLTNDAGKSAKLPITTDITIEPASGGAQTMGASIAVNGVVVANSLRTATASAGSPISMTVPWQENLSPADFVEVFVSNESGTTDVLVSSAVLRVN